MNVIVDTSVWADHFRAADPGLVALLARDQVVMHPLILGELALGNLGNRAAVIAALQALPRIDPVPEAEWLASIVSLELAGSGLGLVDAHLVASAHASGRRLWTRDRRLAARAQALGLDWQG